MKVFILIFLVLSFSCAYAAEDVILKDINGEPVNILNQGGKPLIIFFWTTWCHFCRNEIKSLNQKYSQIEEEGVVVLAINIGESKEKVKKFLKNNGLGFKVLLDEDGLVADKFDVMGVPTYILIDKTGHVILSENSLPRDYRNLLLKKENHD